MLISSARGQRLTRARPSPSRDVRPVTSAVDPAFRFALLRDGLRVAEADPDEAATFWVEAVRDYLDVEPMLRRSRRAFLERMADGS